MRTYTLGELKQGLICCTVYRNCSACPLADERNCTHQLMSAAMNCINVMEQDLAEANKRADDWEELARSMGKERD